MPRLRYRKNYDFDFEKRDDEETSERSSGQSWLSNVAIVSQLSEAKIKQAIIALKAQISCLEAELLSRRSNSGKRSGEDGFHDDIFQIGNLHRIKSGAGVSKHKRRTATAREFKKVAKLRSTLTKLGVTDVDALLKTWSELNEKEK